MTLLARIARFGSTPSLDTPRFALTEVQLDDAPALIPIFQDYDNQELMGVFGDFPKGGVRKLIERWLHGGRKSSFWWKITDKATRGFIGIAQFHVASCSGGWECTDDLLVDFSGEALAREEFRLDLMILPQFQQQGIGTEVARAILAFLFDQVQVPRLKVILNPHLKAYKKAVRLCEKLGFTDGDRTDDTHEFWLSKPDDR
jgi:RimJ/RimL family protein N-acetyltransferase